jgi:uncharacterized protein (TIGR02996 family)
MNDAAFLQAIHDNPDDEAVRLVYADWLEENADESGRARAALIRAQCEAEKLPRRNRRRVALEKEAKRLIDANPEWTAALRKGKYGRAIQFRRGFPHQITMGATQFVQVAADLFAAAPTIRAVVFYHASNEVGPLAECRHLKRLSWIDLSCMCTCGRCPINVELRTFVVSPHLANLAYLSLASDRVDPTTVAALAASPCLPGLRTLDLSYNRIGNAGARSLIATSLPDRLASLDVRGNDIGPVVAQRLRARFGDRVQV